MENYPILNEPGKGRYAIYFRLNERAVGHSADVSHFTGQGQKPDSAFDPDLDLSVRRRLPYLLGGCCLGCLCLKCGLGGCLFGCELLSFLLRY